MRSHRLTGGGSIGSSAHRCSFVDSCPDFRHRADAVVAERDERGYLEVEQLPLTSGRDVCASSRSLRGADAVLEHKMFEPGILLVEPNPRVAVEVFAGVDVDTGKTFVQ